MNHLESLDPGLTECRASAGFALAAISISLTRVSQDPTIARDEAPAIPLRLV
jgi:hypothetical protein